jgi:hypothetical protein
VALMAEKIPIPGASTTAKTRHPVAVGVLVLVTLNIYLIFWWYFANRELVDYGRAKGTDELGDSPAKSTLALFPGGLLIVPAIWTAITTFKRVQAAQRIAGETPLNGWIGLLLYVLITPAYPAYMQSGLNGIWRRQAPAGSAEAGGERPEEAGGSAPQPGNA